MSTHAFLYAHKCYSPSGLEVGWIGEDLTWNHFQSMDMKLMNLGAYTGKPFTGLGKTTQCHHPTSP